MTPTVDDLELRLGFPLTRTYQLFSDTRLKRWRKEYSMALIYRAGDGVRAPDGTPWVCVTQVQNVSPLTIGQTQWSPLTPMNITGYTASAIVTSIGSWAGLTITPSINAAEGKITLTVKASDHTAAPRPSSTHWFLEVTDPAGTPSEPVEGTASFRLP